MSKAPREVEQRVLILAPIGRDAEMIAAMLRAQAIACACYRDIESLVQACDEGAAAILLTEETLALGGGELATLIASQPQWSDIPVLLLTRKGVDSPMVHSAIERFGNVTLHERPIRVTALISAVRSALRARDRQYLMRAHLEDREEASRRKDEFLATLAHELRNPLAPIRNSVQLLRLETNKSAVLEMMERQIAHIVHLVDDLMEVSRITRGKIELRKMRLDLRTVITAALEASRPLMEARRHELKLLLPSHTVIVEADNTRLTQIFSNLLDNAAKYTDSGGSITIDVQVADEMASVAISDTGIGISPSEIRNLFDMFHQSDRHSMSGLGIGLSLSRNLVELHGGSLMAESAGLGTGSQFVVRLPLARQMAIEENPCYTAVPQMPAAQRILIVDDNHDAADSLGALLQLLGADVSIAYDGKSALERVLVFHPRVVFLDLGMPEMDGYRVAQYIREQADSGDIALIALTGWGQEADRARTQAAGFADHLVKPVDVAAIQEVLASL